MKLRIGLLAVASSLGLLLVACSTSVTPMTQARGAGWSHFGDAEMHPGDVFSLGAVEGGEEDVIVEATIIDVCQKKGCWMRVTENDTELFVRFKDYGFFVPLDAAGKKVVMHGKAVAEVASVDELRHYAEDAGKSPEEIAKITEPTERITFFADSVFIRQ